MFDQWRADRLFHKRLKRPDISVAYAMKDENDSWYDTLCKVHNALAEIQKLSHETITIISADGLELKAIHYPCRVENAKNATVIFVHGYTSHAEREWAFPGLFYHAAGYHVIIPYQRAHGLSEGKYISLGALERQDMVLWLQKAAQLHPDTELVVHGLSMGGSIALELADLECAKLKCIISDAPSMGGEEWFSRCTHGVLAGIKRRFLREFGVALTDTDVRRYVRASRRPILLAAGSMENREEQFDELKQLNPQKTEIVILPGCNHGNGMYKQTERFQAALTEFLNQHVS